MHEWCGGSALAQPRPTIPVPCSPLPSPQERSKEFLKAKEEKQQLEQRIQARGGRAGTESAEPRIPPLQARGLHAPTGFRTAVPVRLTPTPTPTPLVPLPV